jgi:CRP-like cAMP-binding protein
VTARHFLAALPAPSRQQVLATARSSSYAPGDVLFRQGDEATTFYLVQRGRVAIHFGTPAGDVIALTVLGPGAVFGELGLIIPRHERTASAVAVDDVTVRGLRRGDFERLRRSHPTVNEFLLSLMAKHLERSTRTVAEVAYLPAARRVACRVSDLVTNVYADPVVRMSQEEIARLAATTRATTNQALMKLQRQGVVTVGRQRIEVHDEPALRAHTGW